jgi:tRNA nucleotidyltransferase (CCA-adding enzyme)
MNYKKGMIMTDFFNNLIEASKQDDFADILERWMTTGVFKVALPEFQDMIGKTHPVIWHPEGDCAEHTLAAIRNTDLSDFSDDIHWLIRLSTFFHDIGKPVVFKIRDDGRETYFGHDNSGVRVFKDICDKHNINDTELIDIIEFCIRNHMKLHLFDKMRQKKIDILVNDDKWTILKGVGKSDIYSRKYNRDGSLSSVNCDEEYSKLDKYPHRKDNEDENDD